MVDESQSLTQQTTHNITVKPTRFVIAVYHELLAHMLMYSAFLLGSLTGKLTFQPISYIPKAHLRVFVVWRTTPCSNLEGKVGTLCECGFVFPRSFNVSWLLISNVVLNLACGEESGDEATPSLPLDQVMQENSLALQNLTLKHFAHHSWYCVPLKLIHVTFSMHILLKY